MDPFRDVLLNIDPYDFEILTAKIWEKQGWEAEVTAKSRDKGVDVIAKQKEPIEVTVAIQAKAHNENNKISSDIVRNYRTLYEQRNDLDAVAIATTSTFTSDAEELADDLSIYTLDMEDILRQIASIDINSFTMITSPFDPDKHEFVDIPHSSDKSKCPNCDEFETLWEGKVGETQDILKCENCDATWKSRADGTWRKIS